MPTGPIGTTGRDAEMFPEFYKNVLEHNPFEKAVRLPPLVCTGPIRYVGHDKLRRDIANLKAGMAAAGVDEGFVPTSAPFTLVPNEYYRSQEEYLQAYAEAVREEALRCRDWLTQALSEPAQGRWDATVVVTHFAPSLRSADPRYGKQPGTASFCNEIGRAHV